jgi:TRAP-type C4-dicarboxylate transport system permease small subunit
VFGIVFIVFSGLAAIINYELDTTLYSSAVPAIFIGLSVLTAMLPFIVSAVLSFAVAASISRTIKSKAEKETETQKTETQAK